MGARYLMGALRSLKRRLELPTRLRDLDTPATPAGGGAPSWVLPGAVQDTDWANDRYYGAIPGTDILLSRASTEIARNLAGQLLPFAPGVFARTDRGLLIQVTRTAKNTNRNVNPIDLIGITKRGDAASIVSIVDDAAKLSSGGLAAVCTSGKVLKLDNSAGTTNASVEFPGTLVTANRHQGATFVRGSGTVAITIVAPGTVTAPAIALPAEYVEITTAQVISQPTRVLSVSVSAGSIAYIALERVEQTDSATTTGVTTPIVIDENVTRAADVVNQLNRTLPPAASIVISGEAAPFYANNQIIFSSNNAQGDSLTILRNSAGEWRVLASAAGVPIFNTGSAIGALANGAEWTIAVSWSNGSYKISVNGGAVLTYTGAAIGALTTIVFGNNGAGEQLNGYLKRVTLFGSDVNAV